MLACHAQGMTEPSWLPHRNEIAADLALLVALAGLEFVLEYHSASMGWPATVLVVRIPVILAVVVLRRRLPMVALALAVADSVLQAGISAALPVAAYAMTRYQNRWVVRAPVLMVATVISVLVVSQTWGLHDAIIFIASALLWPATLGAFVAARVQLAATQAERAARDEEARALQAREAVLDERVRIAREMHDVVGHRVSLMVLHAGAVEMAARDASKVAQLADQMQRAGRQALQELRQLVGLLRSDSAMAPASLAPQPTLEDLDALVEESHQAGMDVSIECRGQVRVLDETVERTAYRVVQEALTNAGRHAPGSAVHVTLDYRPKALTVTVVNRASTLAPTTVAGSGHGLIGLRERAQVLGGLLRADPRLDGGFAVEAVLPT